MYAIQSLVATPNELDRWRTIVNQLDLSPGPGGSRMSDFTTTKPLFVADLARWFGSGRIQQVTVSALYPSCQIVAHKDAPNTVHGVRFHCPIYSNPGCWVFHAGEWQQLVVGQWYEMDPTEVHGAVNWGSEVRLHLLVDTQ